MPYSIQEYITKCHIWAKNKILVFILWKHEMNARIVIFLQEQRLGGSKRPVSLDYISHFRRKKCCHLITTKVYIQISPHRGSFLAEEYILGMSKLLVQGILKLSDLFCFWNVKLTPKTIYLNLRVSCRNMNQNGAASLSF